MARVWPQFVVMQPAGRWSVVHQAALAASEGWSCEPLLHFLDSCPEAANLKNRDGLTPKD